MKITFLLNIGIKKNELTLFQEHPASLVHVFETAKQEQTKKNISIYYFKV